MEKNKLLYITLCVMLAIGISLIILYFFEMNMKSKINEGNFRVNDLVVMSTIKVEESINREVDIYGLNAIDLSLSQENEIAISLINLNNTLKECSITDVDITYPKTYKNILIYDEEVNLDYTKDIDIYCDEVDNTYRINFKIINKDFMNNIAIPENTDEIIYDGTILDKFNISSKDLIFDLSFRINVIELNGTKNYCDINLNIPYESLNEVGTVICREDISKFIFKVKE